MIKSDNYQTQLQWYCEQFKRIENTAFNGCLTWSFAFAQVITWMDYWVPRTNNQWSDDISFALNKLKLLEEKDCARFWIAKYSLTRAVVDGRIRLEHCLPTEKKIGLKEEKKLE